MEESPLKELPKLKEAGILVAQNSALKELPCLKNVGNLCLVDCPIEDLSSLEQGQDVFICSSDENQKIDLKTL